MRASYASSPRAPLIWLRAESDPPHPLNPFRYPLKQLQRSSDTSPQTLDRQTVGIA